MSASAAVDGLVEGVLARNRRSLAKAMTLVENRSLGAEDVMRALFPRTGHAYVVGITGPPGAGKSTIVGALVTEIRRAGQSVGVIAVDPTSPFSGGAVLGDRVRMTGHADDAEVFVRSMATRGNLGGLALTTSDVALLMDAAGFDVVVIETVGVGQDEVDIVRAADTTVVMFVPGTGDDVQALKAGIMEIADVFVVNKADRDGAEQLVQAIRATLLLAPSTLTEAPSVMKTVASTGQGVDDLWNLLAARRTDAARQPARRRQLEESRLRELVVSRFRSSFARVISPEELTAQVEDLVNRQTDPYTVAAEIYERVRTAGGSSTR